MTDSGLIGLLERVANWNNPSEDRVRHPIRREMLNTFFESADSILCRLESVSNGLANDGDLARRTDELLKACRDDPE